MTQEWQRFRDELFVSGPLAGRWRRARAAFDREPVPAITGLASEFGVDAHALQFLVVELLLGVEAEVAELEVATVDLLLEAIDRGVQRLLDAVLHHPRLSSLEAVWRAVAYLAEDVDPASNVVLDLLNVNRVTFDAELDREGALADTAFHRHLFDAAYDPANGPPAPYSVVIGLYDHGPTEAEIARLQRMGELGHRAGWVFLSDGSPRMFGLEDGTFAGLEKVTNDWRGMAGQHPSPASLCEDESFLRWTAFRATEASRYVGLVVGRVRLRDVHRAAFPGGTTYVERAGSSQDAPGLGPPWSSSTVLLAGVIVRAFLRDRLAMNIIGPKSGGAIRYLPDRVPTPDGRSDYLRSECVGGERLEYELSVNGFITWEDHQEFGPGFTSTHGCGATVERPPTKEGKQREATERLEAQLPYRMLLLRFEHYLAVVRRLHHGDVTDAATLENELGVWLARYVSEDALHPYRERPLRRAGVALTRDLSGDGFAMQVTLTPRYYFMGARFTLRSTSWLPA